jgi:hypothetical protein
VSFRRCLVLDGGYSSERCLGILGIPMGKPFPQITPAVMPANEWDTGEEINTGLREIGGHVDEFAAALALFDECLAINAAAERAFADKWAKAKDGPDRMAFHRLTTEMVDRMMMPEKWRRIAAREGAITLHEIGFTARRLVELFSKCDSLQKIVPAPTVEHVLGGELGDFWSPRNASVHPAQNAMESQKHRVRGPQNVPGISMTGNGTLYLACQISGRLISFTVKQELKSFELSKRTLDILVAIANRARAPFYAIEEAHDLSYHEARRRK